MCEELRDTIGADLADDILGTSQLRESELAPSMTGPGGRPAMLTRGPGTRHTSNTSPGSEGD